jgi:hypothetical protein
MRACVVGVVLVVRFEQVELRITLEWTGHKELNYVKNARGNKVVGSVVIRWHQA